MNKLLAGHDTIEAGWNWATWIPAVRQEAEKFDKVVIVCKKSNRYLYEDFADEFEDFDKDGQVGLYGWSFRGKHVKLPSKITKKHEDAFVISPNQNWCTKMPRKYFKYGKFNEKLKYDLVIHARSEVKFGRKNRNWSVGRYTKLLRELRNIKDISVCSIGTKKGAHHIPGTEDKRGVDLRELCNIMASSKLSLGVSSGPMHLALLCGCPALSWSDDKIQKAIGGTNKERYTTAWNPFGTRVKFIDKHGWKPKVETVLKHARELL